MSSETLSQLLHLDKPIIFSDTTLQLYSLRLQSTLISIHLFPLSWRKLIVSTAKYLRIQSHPNNCHLDNMYKELIHNDNITDVASIRNARGHIYTINDLKDCLAAVYQLPALMSTLAYFARAETFDDDTYVSEIVEGGLQKEIGASQGGNRP